VNPLFAAGLLALGLVVAPARADEAQIREALRKRLPPTVVIESVARSPIAGLYEVLLDGEIVYVDEKAEHFFSGSIFDIRTLPPRNLTESRARQMTAQILGEARDLAIKRVKGDGARVLFTFEDPNCSYCKALHREVGRLDNVTLYTFLLPILSDDSVQKARAVWCAKDRARAWDELLSKDVQPAEASPCAHPLERIAVLARRLQVTSTPSIFLGDGTSLGGYRSASDLEKAFSATR
jgi:thiol:disulfide interchange protein DsbC